MTQRPDTYLLHGGLNLITPLVGVPNGMAIGGLNYEPEARGYRRIGGYERFNGRPQPSLATYWVLKFDAGSTAIVAGNAVTGGTSGATATVLLDAEVTSGDWGTSDAAGFLVVTNLVGVFQDNEDIEVSAATVAVADGTAAIRGAANDDDDRTWYRLAISTARAAIAAVPGSGPVRGVWRYGGKVYAVRDNAGGTAGIMHEATATGWSALSFDNVLKFDAGSAEFAVGGTVTGGTSSATATIKRVVRLGGTYSGSDAFGFLVIGAVSGGPFQNNEAITASAGAAVVDGTVSAITLPAGGRYEFINENFYGQAATLRMYFVNGVGRAHEFDGTVLVPIFTGLSDALDKPTHIAEWKAHLFLSFRGGSAQFSSIGEPVTFDALTGAGEIAIGQDITSLLPTTTALMIFGRSKIQYLVGTAADDFALQPYSEEAGAVEWTAQNVERPIYLDDAGVRDLAASDKFGGWQMGTLSQLVEPIFTLKRRQGIAAVASLRVKAKSQYRLYFADGFGVTIYLGRKNPEILPFSYPIAPSCVASPPDDTGAEILFMGSDDGFVYRIDAGTSFDGAEIFAYLRLGFNNLKSPAVRKRFHKATLEIDGSADTRLGLTAEFDYAAPGQPPAPEQSFFVGGGGGFWEEAIWDDFYWSSPVQGMAEAHIAGLGRNVSIAVVSQATHEEPHTLSAMTLNYTMRGLIR
jgi:hypothetical protein